MTYTKLKPNLGIKNEKKGEIWHLEGRMSPLWDDVIVEEARIIERHQPNRNLGKDISYRKNNNHKGLWTKITLVGLRTTSPEGVTQNK